MSEPEACCVCGLPEVGYHNFEEKPFCWPCAEGQPDNVIKALDAMRPRLAAAERACLMFGWTAVVGSDRGKAAHELWVEWLEISGVSMDPREHPDLSDERITELAVRRDEKRAHALARLRELGSRS